MKKEIICTVCPVGCVLTVTGNKDEVTSIEGNQCRRGIEYGENEFLRPVRILTTTVKVENSPVLLLPVRSNKAIPKELLMDCMEEIKKVTIKPPVKIHSTILSNVCGSGADMIATTNIE